VALDVADAASVERACGEIATKYQFLNVLINNAGLFFDPADVTVETMTDRLLNNIVQTNLMGPFRVTRCCLPMLRDAPTGHVVNVTSDMARFSCMDGTYTAYRMTKIALDAFTVNLAAQLRGSNVRVSAFDPGWIRTDMGGTDAPDDPAVAAESLVSAALSVPVTVGGAAMFFCATRAPAAMRPSDGRVSTAMGEQSEDAVSALPQVGARRTTSNTVAP
jgi:NAD(P)-dependent dehydrogenase (short-subunit alcohol dehydrogenase family)